MKFPKEKSAFGDPTSLQDISETKRKQTKSSKTVDGFIVVMSERLIRMEESRSLIESRISSSYRRVNTLLQRSSRMFMFSHHSWPSAGSTEILSEITPSASLSWMKCI